MSSVGAILAEHLACFGELSADDRAAISSVRAEIRPAPRLRDILTRGDRPTSVVVVLKGFLHRYTVGAEGKRQVQSFYLPGEAPSLETLYIDYMDNNLAAVVDSELGFVPHEDLYRIIDERPGARKLLWRQTLVQGAIFREWLMRNSNLPAHSSMAHLFCELFVRASAARLVEGGSFDLPLTQEFVADALGMTNVHANRTIKLLRDDNVLEWRAGRATILDWEKLRHIAGFDPMYLHLRTGAPA